MKMLRKIVISLGTGILWLLVLQYFFANRYRFTEPAPFEGSTYFNPYQGINEPVWLKSNFHAHCHAWQGLTNGKGTANDVHRAYDSLKYDIHAVSNYHEIDKSQSHSGIYIPAYEHGYNLQKTHQQVLGGESIWWNDFVFPQTIHNKQGLLYELRSTPSSVIVLNHPSIRSGYSLSDLERLVGYDCMEVVSAAATSLREWDAALGAGKRVYALGNDDLHNIITGDRLGRACTMLYAPDRSRDAVLLALKKGHAFAVALGPQQDPFQVPVLRHHNIQSDTLSVELSAPADLIKIITERGEVVEKFYNRQNIAFSLKNKHPYYRIEASYANGTTLYFNPIHLAGPAQEVGNLVAVDETDSFMYRIIGLSILLLWIWLVVFRRRTIGQRKLSMERN